MDNLEAKKENKYLQKISFFEIVLIILTFVPTIGFWWPIVKWMKGYDVPFMENNSFIYFLLAI